MKQPNNKTLRNFGLALSLGMSATLASPGANAAIQWNFSSGANAGLSSGSVVSSSYDFIGSATGSDPTGVTANVTGWADDAGAGDIGNMLQQHTVKTWSGLGVDRPGESSPQHAVDNSGPDEFILFNFSQAITLDQVSLGWWSTDSDITVLSYGGVGAPDLTQNTYSDSDLSGGSSVGVTNDGWDFVGHYSNLNMSATVNTGSQSGGEIFTSSYWLVGAYNSKISSSGWSDTNDFLKLKKLVGHTPDDPPPPGVPEPGVLLLFGTGLVGMRLRRRKAA